MALRLIALREDKPNINKIVGDVIESLKIDEFEGKEVVTIGKSYVRIIVTDMSQGDTLEQELLDGVKRFKPVDPTDPFYQDFVIKGEVTTDNSTLLNYVEAV